MKRTLILLAYALCLPACGEKLEPGTPYVADAAPAPTTTTPATGTTDPNVAGTGTTPGGNTNPNATNGNTTGNTTVSANVCGTTSPTIGYAAFASVSIKRSCAASNCHGGSQNPPMTDFATTKTAIQSQGLSAIAQGSMPLGGFKDPNDKCVITTWASGGYLQ